MFNKYEGKDNYGKPKSQYLDKLGTMTDEELFDECDSKIWLSTYAANNPRSDYHWQVNACYDECRKRGKVSIYEKAYRIIEKSL